MTNKFKVGDIVLILREGNLGIVEEVSIHSVYPYVVKINKPHPPYSSWIYDATELAYATEIAKALYL